MLTHPTQRSMKTRMRFNLNLAALLMLVSMLNFSPPITLAQTNAQSEPPKSPTETPSPNLSGVWTPRNRTYTIDPTDPLGQKLDRGPAFTPWGETQFKANKPAHGANQTVHPNDPFMQCFPPGVPRIYLEAGYPMQISQLPDRVIMLFEYDHFYRQIYMDGRAHPKDIDPTWMGHAIGKWDGDTLVVDTVGFNDKTWLDRVGHPHSEALHVVERIHRIGHDVLQDDITIDDPKTYTKPWTGQKTWKLSPGVDLVEDVCLDMGSDYFDYQKKVGMSGTGTPGHVVTPEK
jgi:hypothetical protein